MLPVSPSLCCSKYREAPTADGTIQNHNGCPDSLSRKKHQKRLSAPSHWLLDKLSGVYAPKASPGPHKSRECLPLIIFLRNRLKYALNYRETKAILLQRLIKVDHKVRTDTTYPTGFMDVITIEKTGENFRLIYDTKGRFTVHRIQAEEAEYKLGKVRRVQLGRGGIPFLVTHDARTYVSHIPIYQPLDQALDATVWDNIILSWQLRVCMMEPEETSVRG